MSARIRYRYATTAPQPRSLPQVGALARNIGIIVALAMSLLVIVVAARAGAAGIRNRMPAAPQTAALNAVSVEAGEPARRGGPASEPWYVPLQSATKWRVLKRVYNADGYTMAVSCEGKVCEYESETAASDALSRLWDAGGKGMVLQPANWTPRPAALGARAGWTYQPGGEP